MPTVAVLDGIKIRFYADEHPPSHFHALYGEFAAQIRIRPVKVLRGSLPPARPSRDSLGRVARRRATARLGRDEGRTKAGEDRMNEIVRMKLVEPVLHGVVKIEWMDGYAAVVDLRPVLAKGEVFEFLRASPERFQSVRLGEYGHSIFWMDDEGDEIDFGSDSLRQRAERQAELLRHAS